ncbi:B12-binding domain-containing radical SAM protein [Magnetospirillum sulfuroxidans]|uniref:Radical SAM protein n=1 Tax=Magnetospirillum sulfuroxidans TaxID=611300 RepID=A0ABS5IAP4_9PROT|nr:radical SAM protein [Magnetospirillum sulfuroxidans]MBR9971341.1 radical SAM protein [Magnetospirillum sulfuroxidans]
MPNKAPVIAFVHLPTVLYGQIFDLGADPPYLCMPLGIMYLSATLKQKSIAADIFTIDYAVAARDLRLDVIDDDRDLSAYRDGPELFINEVAAEAAAGRVPDVIAVSLMFSTSRLIAMQITEALKRKWPKAMVIFGGNHATNDVPYLLSHPDVDYVCRGEADWAFPQFINQLAETDRPVVQGFYGKADLAEGKGTCAICVYPEELDELPFPDWAIIEVESYQATKSKRKRDFVSEVGTRNVSIMTSRGCPFSCTFCASHSVHGRKMRFRSVDNVLAEMNEIYRRFGATLFVPEDDLFTANKKRTLALLEGIRGLDIPGLEMEFPNALSVNTLDEDVIDALCRSGMRLFSLAVESGSPHTQVQLIKKRVNLDRARRLVKYANDRDLYTRVNFIIGFPNEKMEHIQETIDFAKTLGADWSVIQVATPLLGSEMFDQFNAMGVLDFDSRNWENTYWDRGFDTEDFTASELVEVAYRANLEVNFLNNRQMRLGQWELAIGVFTDVADLHPFHVIAHYLILQCLEHLGRNVEAMERLAHIRHLVETVDSSADMLRKYGDLVPELVSRLGQVDARAASSLVA